MPNRTTHKLVGAGVGAANSLYRSRAQPAAYRFAETAGGTFGGYLGGLLPDIIEPAVSSWHRSYAHSCATGAAALRAACQVNTWESQCRANAAKCIVVKENMRISMRRSRRILQ